MPQLVAVPPIAPGGLHHGDRVDIRHDIGANEEAKAGDDVLLIAEGYFLAPTGSDYAAFRDIAWRGVARLVNGASAPSGINLRDVNTETGVQPFHEPGTNFAVLGYVNDRGDGWSEGYIEVHARGTLTQSYARGADLVAAIKEAAHLETDWEGADWPTSKVDGYATLWSRIDKTFTYQGGYIEEATFGELAQESLNEGFGAVGQTIGSIARGAGSALGSGVGGLFSGLGWWALALGLLLVLVLGVFLFVRFA